MKHKLDISLFYLSLLIPFSLFLGPAVSDINIVLIGVIFLIIAFYYKLTNYLKSNFLLISLFVCAFFIFTSMVSSNYLFSLESSLFYIRFSVFALAITYVIKTYKNFIKYFTYLLCLTTFLVAIDGIFQFIFSYSIINLFIDKQHHTSGRISGIFGEEYILGSYLSRLLPLITGLLLFLKSEIKINNIFLFIYIFVISLAILISGERTALFMLILFFLLSLFVLKKFLKEIGLFLIVLISMVSLLIVSNNDLKNRIYNKTFNDMFVFSEKDIDGSKNYKLNFFSIQHEVVYITSFKIFKDNVLFGIGPKMFRMICEKEKYKTYTKYDRSRNGCQTHPHNTYVQILVETGIFSFLFFTICYLLISFKILNNFVVRRYSIKRPVIYLEIFCYINIFINFWPIMPAGNFFNN